MPQELKGLLRYTRYHLLDTAVLRGAESQELKLAIAGDLRAEVEFSLRGTPQRSRFLSTPCKSTGSGTRRLLGRC